MTTRVRILGTLGSSHGYQRFMRWRYSSASDGFALLAPSNWAVICCAKPLRNYLLTDLIKRYINKLVLLYYIIWCLYHSGYDYCIVSVGLVAGPVYNVMIKFPYWSTGQLMTESATGDNGAVFTSVHNPYNSSKSKCKHQTGHKTHYFKRSGVQVS